MSALGLALLGGGVIAREAASLHIPTVLDPSGLVEL